eukprot:c23110_g1_i1 orf=340-1248(-)
MATEGKKVTLNVYDLSQGLARQLSATFLGKTIEGIWHTGVVVYGFEYFFGGGIQSCPEGKTPYGTPQKVIELGYTQVPKEMFEEYLQEISPRYTAGTYSLMHHNCNNFSEEVSQFLVGVGIPEFILHLPHEVTNSPVGAVIMPMIQQFETIIRYGGVPQVPHMISPQAVPNFGHIQIPSALASTSQVDSTLQPKASHKISSEEVISVVSPAEGSVWEVSSRDLSAEKTVESPTKHSGLEGRSDEPNMVNDALGQARARVQEEITREFAVLMARGTLRASEAAALATRRVIERHGRGAVTSES